MVKGKNRYVERCLLGIDRLVVMDCLQKGTGAENYMQRKVKVNFILGNRNFNLCKGLRSVVVVNIFKCPTLNSEVLSFCFSYGYHWCICNHIIFIYRGDLQKPWVQQTVQTIHLPAVGF